VKAFHELLAEQMDRAGVTPQALAECAGVNQATAYKWRSGDVAPRPWRIEKIAECIGIDPVKLARALYTETAARISTGRPPSTGELLQRIAALEEQFRKLQPERQ
jgi:hypothetical protein